MIQITLKLKSISKVELNKMFAKIPLNVLKILLNKKIFCMKFSISHHCYRSLKVIYVGHAHMATLWQPLLSPHSTSLQKFEAIASKCS